MSSSTELTAVRVGHEFDEAALEKFLAANLEGYQGPLKIQQFDGGQSNPTFKLFCGSGVYVMRKQPPGELLPSAHQVDREYRIMKALWDTPVPVPEMLCQCDDSSVIGTKFYVMAMVEGRIYSEILLPDVSPAERREMYLDMMRVLAKVHAVDYKAVGLETYGRPGNYYQRQISRWTKQYRGAELKKIDSMDN
ncbi:MAG: phosphotransferase, partial [Flavobacteriaceae bacterium]|nr:phosphotransferase [Flavobacteriaceae bacterium]